MTAPGCRPHRPGVLTKEDLHAVRPAFFNESKAERDERDEGVVIGDDPLLLFELQHSNPIISADF